MIQKGTRVRLKPDVQARREALVPDITAYKFDFEKEYTVVGYGGMHQLAPTEFGQKLEDINEYEAAWRLDGGNVYPVSDPQICSPISELLIPESALIIQE